MWLAAIISKTDARLLMGRAKLKQGQTFSLMLMMAPIGDAQDLPWKNQSVHVPWRAAEQMPESRNLQIKQSNADLTVKVNRDGTIAIYNRNGIRQLRFGLPGRPISMWRDAGQPIASFGQFSFPSHTPLSSNFKSASEETSDFLSNLSGLLWILDDGEEYLTIVHSATYQYVFIHLPGGRDLELRFHPNHLEIYKKPSPDGNSQSWILSWKDFLPVLQTLAKGHATQTHFSALTPYN